MLMHDILPSRANCQKVKDSQREDTDLGVFDINPATNWTGWEAGGLDFSYQVMVLMAKKISSKVEDANET